MDQLEPYPITPPLQIRDVLGILWRRKWIFILVFGAIVAAGVYYARHRASTYEATAQMIVTARGAAPSTSTDATASANTVVPTMVETPATQIGMIMSDGMANRTLDQLKNDAVASGRSADSVAFSDPHVFRMVFAGHVKVMNPLDTNLLEITVTQNDPQLAATWANAICQAFMRWKKELALHTVQDIATSLQTRVNRAREQVAAAEQAEATYKQRNHLVDLSAQQKAALELYAARETDAQTAEQEVEAQQQRVNGLGARLAETNRAILKGTGVRDDQLVLKLQSDLTDLEARRAAAALQYTAEFPGMLPNMDAQIADIKSRLTQAVKGTLDNNKPSLTSQGALFEEYKQEQVKLAFDTAKLNAAVRLRDQLKQDLVGFPATMLEYTRVERNAELARQTYSQLQLALNAALLNVDTAQGNVQVTQAAVAPILPTGVAPSLLVIVFILLGLVSASGAVLLAERADVRVRSVERVRSLVGGPVVGMLPPISRRQMRRLPGGEAPPEVVEAYSLARANLALALRSTGDAELALRHTILVTSALPGEGKSITAAELARSTARSGKRVILVDADMRRPSQGRLFDALPAAGLADVLAGTVTLEEALGAPVAENLTVLHSGNVTRNPTEMISLPQMAHVLARLKELADVVVVDAPACALVADALLLTPYVDCILQVISLGEAGEDLLRDTTAALQSSAPKAMVFFVNRAPRERGRRYRSYYYHTPDVAANGNGRYATNGAQSPLAALPGPEPEQHDKIVKS